MTRKPCYGRLVFLVLALMLGSFPFARAEDPPPAALSTPPQALAPQSNIADSTVGTGVTITSVSKDGVEETRTIAGGVEDILEFDFRPRYTVGDKKKLDVKETNIPGQIRVYPLGPGVSSLTVIDETGKIRKKIVYNIVKTDLSRKVLAIRELLFDIEGITVRALDEKVVIDGELVVPRDLDRIVKVTEAYKDDVLNLVTLSAMSRDAIAKRMQKEINDDPGGVNVTVRLVNDTFFLLGKVDSDADRTRAQQIAETYLPELPGSKSVEQGLVVRALKKVAIRNLIYVEAEPSAPLPKLVRVTLHFVEMSKDFVQNSLFKWNPLYSDTAGIKFGMDSAKGQLHTSGSDTLTGTIANLLPKLQSGANSGFARVLHSAVGIGVEGEKITIRRGDSIPYVASVDPNTGIPTTQYVEAQLASEITPTIMGDNEIQLVSNFSLSVPLGGVTPGEPPSTKSTTMNNVIRVKTGESAALGGLISNDMAKDVNKDPTTSGTTTGSALFSILRSKSFKNNKSQFVVFITPQIIEDASQGTADIKKKFINNKRKRLRPIN